MKIVISLAFLIAILQTAAAQTETRMKGQFGNMIYTIPDGWKVQKFDDGDILTAVGLPKGEFMEIWVEPAMNFSGTMEEALQKSFEETTTQAPGHQDEGGQWSEITAHKPRRHPSGAGTISGAPQA